MKIKNIFICLLLFVCLFDINIDSSENLEHDSLRVNYAGINSKHIKDGAEVAKKSWRWIKKCGGQNDDIAKIANKNKLKFNNPTILQNTNKLLESSEWLRNRLNLIKSDEEIPSIIESYLHRYDKGEGGQIVIECSKYSSEEVKILLYDNRTIVNNYFKIVKASENNRYKNIIEYDITALREETYKGIDGREYVRFIIPKRPEYVLGVVNSARVYECMIFNLPKDIDRKWEKFKEFLKAFMNDIMYRPIQLWDEYMFKRGIDELEINSRDIKEINCYMFVQQNIKKHNELSRSVHAKIA